MDMSTSPWRTLSTPRTRLSWVRENGEGESELNVGWVKWFIMDQLRSHYMNGIPKGVVGMDLVCLLCSAGPERRSAVIEQHNKEMLLWWCTLCWWSAQFSPVSLCFLQGALPIHKATIVPRGSALGMVRGLFGVGMVFTVCPSDELLCCVCT